MSIVAHFLVIYCDNYECMLQGVIVIYTVEVFTIADTLVDIHTCTQCSFKHKFVHMTWLHDPLSDHTRAH